MTIVLIILSLLTCGAVGLYANSLTRNAALKSEIARLEERLKLAEAQHLQASEREKREEDRFRLIANDIITRETDRFRTHGEQRIREILDPLRENIDSFRQSVADCYSREARERFSLQERLRELIDTNASVGREARSLSSALKGNTRSQGQWGEMVLENILESSGLRKDHEFMVQQTISNANDDDSRQKHLRPDVIVKYPDKHCVVIDAKTSLTAFMEYVDAESEEERRLAGARHVESVKRHIDELATKNYQDHMNSLSAEFVMMFIPNEAAYMAAMQLDAALWQKAYDKRVLIVSPTHLVSALQLIHRLWAHDKQTRNAIEIAEAAGRMYDKFCGFVGDMNRIGTAMTSARAAYENAMNKLSTGTGNLTSRAAQLREMGAKATKTLLDEKR